LESATKVVQSWLPAGKEYVCIMRLHKEVAPEKIETMLKEFTGPLYQRPPLRSSVKRRLRIRRVYYTEVLEILGTNVLIRVGCEAGFYMRKLVHDIGEVLGTGAHMLELRRTRAGPFKEDETLVTLLNVVDAYQYWKEDGDEQFLRKVIQPVEDGLVHLAKFYIRDSAVDAICHGAKLTAPGVLKLSDNIKPGTTAVIMTQKGEAVAIAEAVMPSKDILEIDHGVVANTKKVIMPRSAYPEWKSFRK
jgi:H/ACA ribonucleoprotein complex subunit 4